MPRTISPSEPRFYRKHNDAALDSIIARYTADAAYMAASAPKLAASAMDIASAAFDEKLRRIVADTWKGV